MREMERDLRVKSGKKRKMFMGEGDKLNCSKVLT